MWNRFWAPERKCHRYSFSLPLSTSRSIHYNVIFLYLFFSCILLLFCGESNGNSAIYQFQFVVWECMQSELGNDDEWNHSLLFGTPLFRIFVLCYCRSCSCAEEIYQNECLPQRIARRHRFFFIGKFPKATNANNDNMNARKWLIHHNLNRCRSLSLVSFPPSLCVSLKKNQWKQKLRKFGFYLRFVCS